VEWYSVVQLTLRLIGIARQGLYERRAARGFPTIVGLCVTRQRKIGAARLIPLTARRY